MMKKFTRDLGFIDLDSVSVEEALDTWKVALTKLSSNLQFANQDTRILLSKIADFESILDSVYAKEALYIEDMQASDYIDEDELILIGWILLKEKDFAISRQTIRLIKKHCKELILITQLL